MFVINVKWFTVLSDLLTFTGAHPKPQQLLSLQLQLLSLLSAARCNLATRPNTRRMTQWLLRVALGVAAVGVAAAKGDAPPKCKGAQEVGSRRSCIDTIVSNTSAAAECEALCCADNRANPIPYPGAMGKGCKAWFQNQYKQCFMCNGVDSHGRPTKPTPPVNKTEKSCQDAEREPCMTGTVTPAPAPIPPKPPTVIPHLGTESSAQYVNAARGMKVPTQIGNSSAPLNDTTELTELGWPLADCQILIFDHRPTHAWAPPMDDPEHRQLDYSGSWT